MTRVVIDFETRSACDLKTRGTWNYSMHETTEVICMGVKFPRSPSTIVLPDEVVRARNIANCSEVWAHNAFFEFAIWNNVCVSRYGWPPLRPEQMRCAAAVAAAHALPRALGKVADALGLPVQKDAEGARLMLKLSKPRPRRAPDPAVATLFADDPAPTWYEDAADLARLYDYCKRDVEVAEAVVDALGPLSDTELRVWQLDQEINRRGIAIDREGAAAMIEAVADHEAAAVARLEELTKGKIRTGKQTTAILLYLQSLYVVLPDLTAATVEAALAGDQLPHVAREILEIRQSLARSSSAKYETMLEMASEDGRVRDTFLYHGASTGRWAGKGIQPHNMAARIKTSAPPEEMLAAIVAGGLPLFRALYDDDVMAAAGALTRSVITAAPGHDLIAADYSAVEGRGRAWFAGEDAELEVYRSGKDPYVAAAAAILKKSYDDVTKAERQSPGKISELACGYQGGVGAVRKFGGDGMTDEEIMEGIVRPWRQAHPRTVQFWADLEEAAVAAVAAPGTVHRVRSLLFKSGDDKFLKIRLPSGRLLYYREPQLQVATTAWGARRQSVTYMTVDAVTRQWVRTSTYGGKLCENVVSGACRDLMAEAALRLEAAGYPIVMTVHDEIVAEIPEGFGSVDDFTRLMCVVPKWAAGFPLKASGWRGRRYRK